MVDRNSRLEPVLVVERDEVVGIGETGHRELDDVRLLASYGLFVLTNVALVWKPKPVSPMVYCHANSMPRTSAEGPLTCEVTLKIAGAPSGQSHAIDLLCDGAADDEVGHFLDEGIDRDIGVLRVVPLRSEIQIVGQIRQQGRIAACCRQRFPRADLPGR